MENHIKEIKAVKTFEDLLRLRDAYNIKINNFEGDDLDFKHRVDCSYRNLLEKRIEYLLTKGFGIDQIELKKD